jgi:hypothetical protein
LLISRFNAFQNSVPPLGPNTCRSRPKGTQSTSFVRRETPNTTRHSGARRNQGVNRRSGTSRTHTSPSCRINRVAAERDIRLKVGRYRLRERHDERHLFHRLRSGRPVQDRIIAKARANVSGSRGRSHAVEKTLYIHQARGLGFCNGALSGPKTLLGQAILCKYIRPAAQPVGIQKRFGWRTFRHSYSTLLRSVGTEFKVMQELLRHSFVPLNVGCLPAGSNAREVCSAGGGDIAGLFFRQRWNGTCGWVRDCGPLKKGTERARNVPFLCPRWFE